jgi:hypothetical protein
MEDFWSRARRMQGPMLTFGTANTPDWGSNPYGAQQSPYTLYSPPVPNGQIGPSGPAGAYPPQPTTNWGQVPQWTGTAAYPQSGGPWQSAPPASPYGADVNYQRTRDTTVSGGGDDPWGLDPKTAPPPQADTGGARTGLGQPNQPPTPSGTIPPTAGQAKVTVNQDGSWTLPNGVVIPGSTRTTINVNGKQVALPVYWNGGTWRGDNNGHPEDALSMLARRLIDAERRGLNASDPNVIYDEIARLRDDIMSDGINPNDLERLTGITGLHEFVRGKVDAAGKPVGTVAPPGATGSGPTVPGTPGAPGADGAGAAPGTGSAPGAGGDPQYDLFLQQDKAARLAALMDRVGLGTPMRQRGVYGKAVGGALSDLLDPWVQTQGIGGGDVSDISGLIDQFAGRFNAGGGGVASVASDARNAARQAAGNPTYTQGLDDPEIIAMLKGFNQLGSVGYNPWMQRAYGNLQDDSVFEFYNAVNQQARGGGDPAGIRYLPYIQRNPLYGFLTGQ